jgi:hypothetical protein
MGRNLILSILLRSCQYAELTVRTLHLLGIRVIAMGFEGLRLYEHGEHMVDL